MDNIFIERLWRPVKQEAVYIKDYRTPREATQELERFFIRIRHWGIRRQRRYISARRKAHFLLS